MLKRFFHKIYSYVQFCFLRTLFSANIFSTDSFMFLLLSLRDWSLLFVYTAETAQKLPRKGDSYPGDLSSSASVWKDL